MTCKGLGVLIDTSVWVCWWAHKQNYGHLMDPIRETEFYLVICIDLFNEYLRQMKRKIASVNDEYLRKQISMTGVVVNWVVPIDTPLVQMNEKDQPHLNCAHNLKHIAHLLISDDSHFKDIKDNCPIPRILTAAEFLQENTREHACVDAVSALSNIKRTGFKSVFKQ